MQYRPKNKDLRTKWKAWIHEYLKEKGLQHKNSVDAKIEVDPYQLRTTIESKKKTKTKN